MIYEGDYFDWDVNGKTYKTKAPFYLKYWEAGDKVTEWNKTSYAGYNNWRLFTRSEIEKLCTYRGSLIPRKYLESQGWVYPMLERMYFAAQYQIERTYRDYFRSSHWYRVHTNYIKYPVFELDNGKWWDIEERSNDEQRPENLERNPSLDSYHWNIVRTMGDTELSNYFW